jgi:hypothetical protein
MDVEELQSSVRVNPFNYDAHVALIHALEKNGDVDGLAAARRTFSQHLPLPEGVCCLTFVFRFMG